MTREQFEALPIPSRIRRIKTGRVYWLCMFVREPFLERGSDSRFVCGYGHIDRNGNAFGRSFSFVPEDFEIVN